MSYDNDWSPARAVNESDPFTESVLSVLSMSDKDFEEFATQLEEKSDSMDGIQYKPGRASAIP